MIGQEIDLDLGFFAFGNVNVGAHHAQGTTHGVAPESFSAAQNPLPRTIFGAHAVLNLKILNPVFDALLVDLQNPRDIVRVDKLGPTAYVHGKSTRFIAQQPEIGRAEIPGIVFGVPVPNSVMGGFHGPLKALLGFAQRQLCTFGFNQVPHQVSQLACGLNIKI